MTTATATINAAQALELLERAVAERGADFVYSLAYPDTIGNCLYRVDGAPACIAGLALSYTDIPYRESWEGDTVDGLELEELTDGAVCVLSAAQSEQDSSETWGTALAAAREIAVYYPVVDGIETSR